jgi:hypothetical protein
VSMISAIFFFYEMSRQCIGHGALIATSVKINFACEGIWPMLSCVVVCYCYGIGNDGGPAGLGVLTLLLHQRDGLR